MISALDYVQSFATTNTKKIGLIGSHEWSHTAAYFVALNREFASRVASSSSSSSSSLSACAAAPLLVASSDFRVTDVECAPAHSVGNSTSTRRTSVDDDDSDDDAVQRNGALIVIFLFLHFVYLRMRARLVDL